MKTKRLSIFILVTIVTAGLVWIGVPSDKASEIAENLGDDTNKLVECVETTKTGVECIGDGLKVYEDINDIRGIVQN